MVIQSEKKIKQMIVFILMMIVLLVSLPAFLEYCFDLSSLEYQLLRIEGLKEGILKGNFPIRIQPNWLNNYGYAVSIFESDLFLLVPAFLRIIGFDVQTTYHIFLILINILTTLISYYYFNMIFKNRVCGILGSMLFVFSPYRIFLLYVSNEIGEVIAISFLPMLIYGIYKIYVDFEYNSFAFLIPTVAFTAMIHSSIIQAFICAGIILLVGIIMGKYTFRKYTILHYVKMVGTVLICNLWFLLPLGEFFIKRELSLLQRNSIDFQEKGIYLVHFLLTFYKGGSNTNFAKTGMIGTASIGIGFATLICLLAYFYIWFILGIKKKNKDNVLRNIVLIIGVCCLILSCNSFPWHYIQYHFKYIGYLMDLIETPMRFLGIVTCCFVFISCHLVKISKDIKFEYKLVFSVIIFAISLFTTYYLMQNTINSQTLIVIHNQEELDSMNIKTGNYLPIGTRLETLKQVEDGSIPEEDSVIEILENEYFVSNQTGEEKIIRIPRIYYKGYIAINMLSGDEMEIVSTENKQIGILIPAEFEGNIKVEYTESKLWILADIISIIGITVMLICFINMVLLKKEKTDE